MGNTISESSKKCKITGIASIKNTISIVGLNISVDTKDKVERFLNENNLKFNNLNYTNMQISIEVEEDTSVYVQKLHNLFFRGVSL